MEKWLLKLAPIMHNGVYGSYGVTGMKRTTKNLNYIIGPGLSGAWAWEAKQPENTGQRGTSWIEFLTTMAVQST